MLLLLLVVLLFSSCALSGRSLHPPVSDAVPPQSWVTDVPFFPQKSYQCGPAALAAVLTWSAAAVTPEELVDQVYLPGRRGSLQSSLTAAARRYGRLVYPVDGPDALLAEIVDGNPVLVLQNLGLRHFALWHYAVVIGYDLLRQEVILHSGTEAAKKAGLRRFLHTWQLAGQWGVVVLPPDRLPAAAQETTWLKAALDLQQAGREAAALIAFEAAAERWPQNAVVFLSLGNARYAAGDPAGAAEAFRRAAVLEPDNGVACNNLAHVLAQLGRWEEAAAAARRAVELGGPQAGLFQDTLDDILRHLSATLQ